MALSKKVLDHLKIKTQNNKRLKNILDFVVCKMKTQEIGCFIPKLGVSFIDHSNQTRDPIGHLLGYSDLKGFWGLISSEHQKPLVNKIKNKYNLNLSYASEHFRFVKFLQLLQDAHDTAFDEFNNVVVENVERMNIFLVECNKIKIKFQL